MEGLRGKEEGKAIDTNVSGRCGREESARLRKDPLDELVREDILNNDVLRL